MIKIEKLEQPSKGPINKYPYVGKANDGEIVIFIKRSTGLSLNNWEYSDAWIEFLFTPIDYPITLSNVKE